MDLKGVAQLLKYELKQIVAQGLITNIQTKQ